MLNARKHLQPPHYLLVNVLICNFTTAIEAIQLKAIVGICISKGDNYFVQRIVVYIFRLLGQFFLFFFMNERYFKGKKHKQKHLSNIQLDISKSKKASKLHSFKEIRA